MSDLKNTTLSYSGIKAMLKSIDHFIAYKTTKTEPTDDMRFGSAFDRYLLEGIPPLIMPKGINLKTNDGKAQRNALQAEAVKENRELVKVEDMTRLQEMKAAVMAHPVARSLMELPATAQHEDFFDYDMKGTSPITLHRKMDWYFGEAEEPVIVDLKTIKSADIEEITRSIASLKYYIQAAVYMAPELAAGRLPDFHFLFVETEAPFGVQVVDLHPDWIIKGQEEIEFACRRFAAWRDGKLQWTGYSDKAVTVDMPNWLNYKKKNEGGTVSAKPKKGKPATDAPKPAPAPAHTPVAPPAAAIHPDCGKALLDKWDRERVREYDRLLEQYPDEQTFKDAVGRYEVACGVPLMKWTADNFMVFDAGGDHAPA